MPDTTPYTTALGRIIPKVLFPLTLAATLAMAAALYNAEVASPEIIAAGLTLIAGFWIWLWEYLAPYREHWNDSDDDFRTNVIHLLVSGGISNIVKPLYILLLFPVVTFLGEQFGHGHLWPHQWPVVLQLALMLVLCEFNRYWIHRWSHQYALLWRFHAVHHSPNRLYWWNAGRFHPVERFYLQFAELLFFILLQPSEEVLMLYLITNSVHGFFQHANIRTNIGWLNYVFAMTELHRWHHSATIRHSNSNYGNNLIIWDALFGTRCLPEQPQDIENMGLGKHEAAFPQTWRQHLLVPLRWKSMEKETAESATVENIPNVEPG